MKSTGTRHYDREDESKEDMLCHDINAEVKTLRKQLDAINKWHSKESCKTIKKQLIEVILETL